MKRSGIDIKEETMLQFGKNLDEKETLFGCTLGLSRFNSLAQIQHSKSLVLSLPPRVTVFKNGNFEETIIS